MLCCKKVIPGNKPDRIDLTCRDLIGIDFEVTTIEANGVKTTVAYSLEPINGKHQSLVINNGFCESREASMPIAFIDDSEYGHCVLDVDSNGLIYFEPLPYRPSPYPIQDISAEVLIHMDEDKVWAICGDDMVIYKNDQTSGRFVCQKIQQNQNSQARIAQKVQNGYVRTGVKTFSFATRDFI